jgi:hypothetical protein
MGLPQVNVSAVPMTERGINVLNLPLISGFVNNSIAAAANEYVAPKSMSLEVGKLISGDNVKKGIHCLIFALTYRYRCGGCFIRQNTQCNRLIGTRSQWFIRHVHYTGVLEIW